MATKTKSAVESLKAQIAALNAQIAALTSEASGVSVEAVRRFTQQHWHDLRFAMVVGGAEKPQLAKGRKGYALVKGADPAWYMACKGFETTLKSLAERKANGEDVEVRLYETPNERTGISQVQRAQEVLSAMVEAGFIDANSKLLTGDKAKVGRPRKSSK